MRKTIIILAHTMFDDSPYCIFIHNHAKALVKEGYNVKVIAAIPWLPIISRFQKNKTSFMKKNKNCKVKNIDGVEVYYKKVWSFSNLLYNSKINVNGFFYYLCTKNIIRKMYNTDNVVLIDAHTFKVEGYVAKRLKEKYKTKTTVTLHGTSFFRNTRTKNGIDSIKKVFSIVDYAVCVSDMIQKMLMALDISNSKVIYNGIEQHEFKKIAKNMYNIVSVGTLIPRKNFNVSIETISRLRDKYPNLHLSIVGVGDELGKLKAIVDEYEIQNMVTFLGYKQNDEVLKLMNESYIFLMPSVREGFGIVYAEAMKARCITIGTKGEGIDGFIENGKNGFLVNCDVDEISNLVDKIYQGKYDIDKLKEEAFMTAKELTWDNNAKKYIELIELRER